MKVTVMTDSGNYLCDDNYINQVNAAFVEGNQQQINIGTKQVTLRAVDRSRDNEIIIRVSVSDQHQSQGMGY